LAAGAEESPVWWWYKQSEEEELKSVGEALPGDMSELIQEENPVLLGRSNKIPEAQIVDFQ
jgi:hypothetical protein